MHDQRVETVLIICSDFSLSPHFHDRLRDFINALLLKAALCAFSNDAETVFLSSSPFNHNKV